ncbi:YmfQ family protein [Burkholderia sp. BDU5]|uniref:YmfQ family protein n=1 Tax=Burkholderia sp. BDU5 TaxID=1385590 RepID=UPI001E30AD12|nr:putative phage tail protein [Burkholderia sp. BDU5]
MLRALLPPGPAWSREQAPQVHRVLAALAPEFSRIDARARDLLDEMDAATVRELVPDWERVCALPDECLGPAQSFEERQREVRKRLLGVGGQRVAYFEDLARENGYPDVWIEEHRAPRFGRARFGVSRFGTWQQQYIWTVHLGRRLAAGRRWGVTVWGERFGRNPAEGIECLIRKHAPAQTLVLFDYEV